MVNAWLLCSSALELGSVVLGATYNNIRELFTSNHSADIHKASKTRCVYSYYTKLIDSQTDAMG